MRFANRVQLGSRVLIVDEDKVREADLKKLGRNPAVLEK